MQHTLSRVLLASARPVALFQQHKSLHCWWIYVHLGAYAWLLYGEVRTSQWEREIELEWKTQVLELLRGGWFQVCQYQKEVLTGSCGCVSSLAMDGYTIQKQWYSVLACRMTFVVRCVHWMRFVVGTPLYFVINAQPCVRVPAQTFRFRSDE